MSGLTCGMQAPECVGLVIAACGLSWPEACGILVPWTGIEPVSPALEGGFLTTGPPEKSLLYYNLTNLIFCNLSVFI